MEGPDNSKQYSLRWEKHAFNLASEAGCFFEDESFLDCTLSAEGQCIDAHKIILSASSSYLSNLLKIMPDKHPILIFNDIKFELLKSLVAFIYNGSVNVSESNIHAFLNAAQSLLIKGLSEETKDDDRNVENFKRHPNSDVRVNHRRQPHVGRPLVPRKVDPYLDGGKILPRKPPVRQPLIVSSKPLDGGHFVECEESLSKLQEISFTKYIHQNLNAKSHVRSDAVESKWNGPGDDKLRGPENYVVKSWKHNSIDDLNGRHKQNKNSIIKKIKLEKPIVNSVSGPEDADTTADKSKSAAGPPGTTEDEPQHPTGNHTEARTKSDDVEDKIKKEVESEEVMLVEPKQEMTEVDDDEEEPEGEDGSAEGPTDGVPSDYDGRPVSNFYHHQSVVDRGVPVPLLMCRTSLSEPDSVEPNWMPQVTGNAVSDHHGLHHGNSIENNVQDVQCRTCAQDLPCPTCTKKYKSRYALNRHILYECGKARKSFSCDECGKKVTRQDTLQKHKLIHLVQHLKKKESETDEDVPKAKKPC